MLDFRRAGHVDWKWINMTELRARVDDATFLETMLSSQGQACFWSDTVVFRNYAKGPFQVIQCECLTMRGVELAQLRRSLPRTDYGAPLGKFNENHRGRV